MVYWVIVNVQSGNGFSTMKRICIPYLHDETGGKALASAAVIASRFKAHIDIVHIRQRITPVLPGNVYSPVIVSNIEENLAILTEDAKQRAAALKSEALKICNDRSRRNRPDRAHG